MGIINNIRKSFRGNPKSNKSFNEDYLIGNNGIFSNSISYNSKNPITENIYNTIANDISLLKFKHVLENDEDYQEFLTSDLSWILQHRTNDLESPTEFWQAFTYNLVKFGNGIAVPKYNTFKDETIEINGVKHEYQVATGKNVQALENLDVSKMKFGFGYDENNEEKYLIYKKTNDNFTSFLGHEFHYSNDDELYLVPYKDVIHVRYIPSNIFHGDQYNLKNWNIIADLFDANLNSLITNLNNSGKIKGILKLTEGQLGDENSKPKKLKAFYNSFLKDNPSKIAVLDMHEEFTPLDVEFDVISKDDLNNMLDFLYKLFGVNSNIIEGTYTSDQYSAYFHHTLAPIIARIHDEINYKLLSKSKIKKGERIIVYKALTVGSSIDEIVNLINKGIYNGVLTPNELRDMLGLAPYKEGDNFYSNLNAVEIGGAPDTQGVLEPRLDENNGHSTSDNPEEVNDG